ncbi:thioredoxin family protein [Nitratiruptor sp. YY09-18]|uniref:thioredoxin family protein n=1 Tax=Nitratiruptor sp. YY09-18 TaxID=2724901 RepID=UPI0019163EB4|nr:thioredoxin family protein [Nitratiruptor sp. YY09-18]BCD68493.1 hypothetical protein NitYY0918_C1408 [Nitratiruptor sp. YY09-18]
MKKVFLIVTIALSLFAQITWQNDFEKAYKESLESGKPLFVFIERRYPPCKWCERMQRTTLADQNISNYINNNFIPVKLEKSTSSYPSELYPRYVPTIYVIKGEYVIKKIIGYWNKNDFWSDLRDVERLLNSKSKRNK